MKFIIFILYVVIQGIKIKIDREVYVDDSKDVPLKSLFANDNKRDKNIEYVDSYSFLDKYREIFGSDLTISKEEQNTTTCGAVNYKNDVYYPNWYCKEKSDDSIIVTYLKNVTIDKEYLNINKYYAFIVKTDENTFDLYSSDEKEEKTLIATNLSIYEISNYINEMNIMSYRFKKINNQYYLNNIK